MKARTWIAVTVVSVGIAGGQSDAVEQESASSSTRCELLEKEGSSVRIRCSQTEDSDEAVWGVELRCRYLDGRARYFVGVVGAVAIVDLGDPAVPPVPIRMMAYSDWVPLSAQELRRVVEGKLSVTVDGTTYVFAPNDDDSATLEQCGV